MRKILLGLACLAVSYAHSVDREPAHNIAVEIKIECPESEEFDAFVKSIPSDGPKTDVSYEDWKNSFTENMTKLIALVQSGKVFNSQWNVGADKDLQAETTVE